MAELGIPGDWFVADTTVDEMYRRLVPELAAMWKLRVERPSPTTLVVRHQTRPGWMWVKTAQTATITGADVEGGARFTATGKTSAGAVIAIRRAFGVPDEGDAPPPSAEVADSEPGQLDELASLRDRGILTEEEFEAAKARLSRE
jgi:hypothetical protein